jgi:Protein of unknown function (DUF2933)
MVQNSIRNQPSKAPSRWSFALVVFIAIGGYFLLTEHQAHVFYVLPWLLLFVCPLLHFWMHGAYGSHSEQETRPPRDRSGINTKAER